MEDILAILNTLSLALQKQGILLVDIKHIIKIVIQKMRGMSKVNTSASLKMFSFQ